MFRISTAITSERDWGSMRRGVAGHQGGKPDGDHVWSVQWWLIHEGWGGGGGVEGTVQECVNLSTGSECKYPAGVHAVLS